MESLPNTDSRTVDGFGDEWTRYNQSELSAEERATLFQSYFHIFPWECLPKKAQGFDVGSGSGRWAMEVAKRVSELHCVDASSGALAVAKRNLANTKNCQFHLATASELPFASHTMDFGYSLGVLHHIPDTTAGIRECVRALKPGAPFLLYLYYRFDNRPLWYILLWKVSDFFRQGISSLPHALRSFVCKIMAIFVYFPLARTSFLLEKLGISVRVFPLSSYRHCSFYTMQTDALDRFGTSLEKRFTRAEIQQMLLAAGLDQIKFSETPPFWCAIGYKK